MQLVTLFTTIKKSHPVTYRSSGFLLHLKIGMKEDIFTNKLAKTEHTRQLDAPEVSK